MNRRHALTLSAVLSVLPGNVRAEQDLLKLRELYDKGVVFSDLAHELDGQRVRVEGYMAPLLKASSHFFMLTKMPMDVCPFCEPGGEWPCDILAIYTRRLYDVVPFNRKIIVAGTLRLTDHIDQETGEVRWGQPTSRV